MEICILAFYKYLYPQNNKYHLNNLLPTREYIHGNDGIFFRRINILYNNMFFIKKLQLIGRHEITVASIPQILC